MFLLLFVVVVFGSLVVLGGTVVVFCISVVVDRSDVVAGGDGGSVIEFATTKRLEKQIQNSIETSYVA